MPVGVGPDKLQNARADDCPLEAALLLAAQAGRFDVVAQLAKELEARRLAAAPNIVTFAHRPTSRR